MSLEQYLFIGFILGLAFASVIMYSIDYYDELKTKSSMFSQALCAGVENLSAQEKIFLDIHRWPMSIVIITLTTIGWPILILRVIKTFADSLYEGLKK